ncbi:MAG: M23 family metallopeptidase, partial [Lachnospiraceae bacterium]|nr:M23 family metallopeptidase [Lachnospiraceae bacterium]
ISFTEEQSILWPSAGTVVIDYSMDKSVYFSTLNQYKYNPALIISSAAGNQVLASAKGIVESITINEETGTTLVMNIGNGYKLTYGQLMEPAVSEGDIVEAGDLLAYISEPTKYYCAEGSNLYFAMTKDGEPVDPVLYLE